MLVVAVGIYLRAATCYAALRLIIAVAVGLAPIAIAWLTKALIDDLTAHRTTRITVLAVSLAAVSGVQAATQHLNRFAPSGRSGAG